MRLIILALLTLASASSFSLGVMTINTEFMWDHKAPHEGRIVTGTKAPTKAQYDSKLQYFAKTIAQNNAHIVGLQEIEGCHIARDLKILLGKRWNVACKKGRDTYTGQDVAILTTLKVIKKSVNNHKHSYSRISSGKNIGKKVRPSKAVTAVLIDAKGTKYAVTVAHLISRTRDQDPKRIAQAEAIRKTIDKIKSKHQVSREIVMGDFNDYRNTPVLSTLKGSSLVNHAGGSICTYTYRGNCRQIDHILTPKGMTHLQTKTINHSKKYTDHQTLFTLLK